MNCGIFKKVVSVFMSFLSMLLFPIFGDFAGAFTPKAPYEVRLNFATVSDTHITDKSSKAVYEYMLGLGLDDMADSEYPLDAIVHAGDITDHGERAQWENVYKVFSEHNKVKNVILATGNHDTWTNDEANSLALFKEYNEKICGRQLENIYYSTKINGYTFVVIGSEGHSTDADISNEQLTWLSETMSIAAEDGLPIFVICHQPLNYWHGLPDTWGIGKEDNPLSGGMGEQSDVVKQILKSYDNVFYINGHIHDGFGENVTQAVFNYKSIESEGSFHSINVPCYSYLNTRGQVANGTGFVFEVYDDSVVIRGRSYTGGVWYTFYEYTFELV